MRRTGLDPTADCGEQDFVVFSGGLPVGRIYRIHAGPQQGRWFWAIIGVHAGPGVMCISDRADSLHEAKAQLAENWRKWLAWARLRELDGGTPS